MTEDVMQIIYSLEEPVFTASEIVEQTDASRPTVHKRLRELEEEGVISRKDVGSRAVAWWRVEDF
jgi:DNA-binding GntR family transcriptional regulator